MLGFFKKKPTPQSPSPAPMAREKIDALNRELSEFAEGEIDPVEGALTMLHVSKDRSIPALLDSLSSATVLLLLGENNPRTPPLQLQSPRGYPVLAVFTKHKRATKCQERHPEQQYFLQLPFSVALKQLQKGAGIFINPYEDIVTLDLPPHVVDAIRGDFLGEAQQPVQPPSLSKYRPGQVWAFHSSAVAPGATLTILRVENHEQLGKIVHISVSGLRLPNGGTSIDHMPFTEASIDRSATKMIHDGDGIVKPNDGYDQWREQRGGVFTISVADGINSIKQAVAAKSGDSPR